jgi:hypothetical protein
MPSPPRDPAVDDPLQQQPSSPPTTSGTRSSTCACSTPRPRGPTGRKLPEVFCALILHRSPGVRAAPGESSRLPRWMTEHDHQHLLEGVAPH